MIKKFFEPKNYVDFCKVITGYSILQELKQIKRLISISYMSNPIYNFVKEDYLMDDLGHYSCEHYADWRVKRIKKILLIYGIEWEGKRILELGGGFGDIGAFFAKLGAEVISLEGRKSNVNMANLKYKSLRNFKSVHHDVEEDFTHFGYFDLIINFGLIEVVDNIQPLLECSVKMSNNIILETMVCDSIDPLKVVKVSRPDGGIDSNISLYGSHPSPAFIEAFFKKEGYSIERHFTSDLNSKYHYYDWKHKNDNRVLDGMRRFWNFRKNEKTN